MQKFCQVAFVIVLISVFTTGFSYFDVLAQGTPTGKEVIEKNYYREDGKDETSNLVMTLINKSGDKRIREIVQFTKEYSGVEKKIVFFVSPADVRNTSFLNLNYDDVNKNDDQWIYLPALKKIKRISSESKGDYFMGSDFTYDDISDRTPDQDNHKLLRTEELNNETCYVVESTPKEKSSMYSKTISWVIKDKWLFLKREFYDKDKKLLKVERADQYKQIDGIWTTTHRVMENVQKNHITDIVYSNYKYNIGIDDSKFTEQALKMGL